MNKKQIQQVQELIDSRTNICLDLKNDITDIEEIESLEELTDYIQENRLLDEEVIYYHNAMDYLKENDQSLLESLEIAKEYGFNLEDLSSEVLASLLHTRNNEKEFAEISKEIEEIFNN